MLADVAIALLLYRAALRWFGERPALVAAGLYLFVPVTWYDSALWGQVDAIGALLMLAALLLLIDGRGEAASAAAALSVLVKPQDAVVLVVVLPVLVRRHLIEGGSRHRLLTSLAACAIALVVPLLPFDIARFAPSSLASVPIAGQVAGLAGLVTSLGGRYGVLTANAYNLWSLVGPSPLATILARGGAWTLDSLPVVGGISAFVLGAALLGAVGVLVAAGLLVRHDRLAILLGFTVAAFAFYALPTRVHERYLFPAFVTGALLVAGITERAFAYLAIGALNAINIHGILAGAVVLGPPGGRGRVPFGGRGGSGVASSIRLPFGAFARDEVVVGLVALGQTAALVGLVAAWIYIVSRSITMRPWSARSASSSSSRWPPVATA